MEQQTWWQILLSSVVCVPWCQLCMHAHACPPMINHLTSFSHSYHVGYWALSFTNLFLAICHAWITCEWFDTLLLKPSLHMSMKMTALLVRCCKDHNIVHETKDDDNRCKLWKEWSKEWVAIVVTNYGRKPIVRAGDVQESCVLSEWKWSSLLHKERFPIPISWSHGPKWLLSIKIFIHSYQFSAVVHSSLMLAPQCSTFPKFYC